MKNEKPESLIIEASPRGISAVTVRVSRDHRERGFTLLRNAMPSIVQLDKDLRFERARRNESESGSEAKEPPSAA